MKYPCIETTLDIYLASQKIRLWLNEKELKTEYDNQKIADDVRLFLESQREVNLKSGQKLDYKKVIEFLEKIPNLNAAQICEKNGAIEKGLVVYFVDFGDKDPHG